MSRLRAALLAFILVLSGAFPAFCETRVALVIANSTYRNAPRLANPANDGPAVAAALRKAGFATVTVTTDLDQQAMRSALQTFAAAARRADMAVLYFAGHGMEIGGENYLLPIDARLASSADVSFETIPLKLALEAVTGARRLGVVMLDACRNNPFAADMKMTVSATRAVSRGLTRVEPVISTLVVYAARDGTTADDGAGANSPFAKALIRRLPTPGLEVGLLFRQVTDDVMQETERRQQPFVYGSLGGEPIYFLPSPDTVDVEAQPLVTSLASGGATSELAPDVRRAVDQARHIERQARWRAKIARQDVFGGLSIAPKAADAAQRAERGETGYGVLVRSDAMSSRGAVVSGRYAGQVSDGKAKGLGVEIWSNGDLYEGEWLLDQMSGWIVQHFGSGSVFAGRYLLGTPMSGADYGKTGGVQFYGTFQEGKGNRGTLFDDSIESEAWYRGAEVSGDFLDEQPEGYAVVRKSDGRVLAGQWSKGRLSGLGATFDRDGRIVEQGVYKANVLETPRVP